LLFATTTTTIIIIIMHFFPLINQNHMLIASKDTRHNNYSYDRSILPPSLLVRMLHGRLAME
jgi:hypothetical protein